MSDRDDPFCLDDEFGKPAQPEGQNAAAPARTEQPSPAAVAEQQPHWSQNGQNSNGHRSNQVVEPTKSPSQRTSAVAASLASRPCGDQLTPSQQRTFDELLAIGAERPTAPTELVKELRARLLSGTATATELWTEPSLWFGKSQLTTASRCEGMVTASRTASGDRHSIHPATATGIVAHRAIQMAHTHASLTPAALVNEAVTASMDETAFSQWWQEVSLGVQSDLVTAAISKVISFLDSWPPLDPSWAWRFEESVQARIGRLTLGARIDLVLGRPRADGRQTMVLCDMKTSGITEHHDLEASFYALVCALRHGVPPWRSCVYSLSSGEWSDPDITPQRLMETVDVVVKAVNSTVDVLTEQREATLSPDSWCRWCPAVDTCPVAEVQ